MLDLKTESAFPVYELAVTLVFFAVLLAIVFALKKSKRVNQLVKGQQSGRVANYRSTRLDKTTRLIELSLNGDTIYLIETDKGLVQVQTSPLDELQAMDEIKEPSSEK